ncbi:MAG: type II secretion system F family protein [Deltaproteobacteria bacterium]|nr:type II secretion system F family protein [Deltaproteobacteria bacterium]
MTFVDSFVPSLLIGLAALCALIYLLRPFRFYRKPKGDRAGAFDVLARKSPLYKIGHQVIWLWAYWLAFMIPTSVIEKLDKKMEKAGTPGGLNGIEFLATVPLSIASLSMTGGILSGQLADDGLPGALLGLVLGTALPFAKLDTALVQRKRAILIELPTTIDLLALCMRAGQNFNGALKTVSSEMQRQHPLRLELEHMSARIALGASYTDALKSLAARVDLVELRQFAQSAIRAQVKGSSLADVLSIQAEIIRTRRSQNAEQTASRAAVAMLGPLMLIFLAVFVLLLGPFGVKAWYGTLM